MRTMLLAAVAILSVSAADADGYRKATGFEQVKAYCELYANGANNGFAFGPPAFMLGGRAFKPETITAVCGAPEGSARHARVQSQREAFAAGPLGHNPSDAAGQRILHSRGLREDGEIWRRFEHVALDLRSPTCSRARLTDAPQMALWRPSPAAGLLIAARATMRRWSARRGRCGLMRP